MSSSTPDIGIYVEIRRDPFARATMIRRVVHSGETCSWCGQRREDRNGRELGLFEYGWFMDGLYTRPVFDGKVFCSVGCRDTYYS